MLLQMVWGRWVVLVVVFAFVAPSAEAGTLAYSRFCGDVPCTKFFLVEDDGTGLREVAPPDPGALGAVWSQDGTRLVYERFEELRSIAADGSDDRLILHQTGSSFGAIDWSPTEDLLAFAFTDNSPVTPLKLPAPHDIYIAHSDGSGFRRIAGGPGVDSDTRFTADGKRIEFYSAPTPWDLDSSDAGLYSVAVDGSDEHRLTLGAGMYNPTPSPDGRYFAFGKEGVLWTMDAGGGDLRSWRTPGNNSIGFVWSTEAPRLFFLSSPVPGDAPWTIHVADLSRPDEGASPLPGDHPATGIDWTGERLLDPIRDSTPPAVMLVDERRGAATATAARRRVRVISKKRAELLAFDTTGIRAIKVALAKPVRRRGVQRCRFLGRGGHFGRPRRCSKPVFRRVGSEAAFSELIADVRLGRYLMVFRTTDVRGNRQRHPRLSPVRIRP
jgi:WD40 repeat protein